MPSISKLGFTPMMNFIKRKRKKLRGGRETGTEIKTQLESECKSMRDREERGREIEIEREEGAETDDDGGVLLVVSYEKKSIFL